MRLKTARFDEGPAVSQEEQPSLPMEESQPVEVTGAYEAEYEDVDDDDDDDSEPPAEDEGQPRDDGGSEESAELSEDLYWAEVTLAGSIAEVERTRAELEDEIKSARDLVSETETELHSREATLSNLREQHKAKTEELLALARKLMTVASGKQLPTEASQQPQADSMEGWRAAATAELCQGIKGLSKKKMESLVDQAATAGQLEDLRAVASQQCKQFHEVLPKGIGQGVANSIEDRLVNHVAEWVKRARDPDRAQLADELVAKLRSSAADWTEEECIPKDSDDAHLHAGFNAYDEGIDHHGFLSDDRAKAHLWMTGWVGAERLASLRTQAKASA